MNEFKATHVIQTGTLRTPVSKVELDQRNYHTGARVFALYTAEEWAACDNADWTYDEEEGLFFQGSQTAPICDGASIETL